MNRNGPKFDLKNFALAVGMALAALFLTIDALDPTTVGDLYSAAPRWYPVRATIGVLVVAIVMPISLLLRKRMVVYVTMFLVGTGLVMDFVVLKPLNPGMFLVLYLVVICTYLLAVKLTWHSFT